MPFPKHLNIIVSRHTTKDIAAFTQAVKSGKNLTQSKLAAGYTENVANMGVHHLAKPMRKVWLREQTKLINVANAHSAAQQEQVVRGLLLTNLYEGKDRAVQSAKLLGQDKRVNMFTADNQVGVIVLQPPAGLLTELQQRIIEANPVTITSDNATPSDE